MVEIRPARDSEEGAWRTLWKTVFGDGDAMLDSVSRCCPAEEIILLLEGGRLASMVALPPVELALPGGQAVAGAYVYALATAPEYRKRGFGRQLLHWADEHLRGRGIDCVTVVPAQASLHDFFATAGFSPCFCTHSMTLAAGEIPAPDPSDGVQALEPEEYNRLRNTLLPAVAVRYPGRLITLQGEMSRLTGGGLYRVTAGGATGCAAVECGADGAVIKELLVASEGVEGALAALHTHLSAPRYQVRLPHGSAPLSGGTTRPFGMLKWLTRTDVIPQEGYLGLGFD